MLRSAACLGTLVVVCIIGLVIGFRPSYNSPSQSSRPVTQKSCVRDFDSRTFSSRGQRSRLFQGPPGRPTRENEPDEYFKSNLEKKELSERLVDPQVLIAVVSILAPFVAVGILLGGGFLTQ